MNFVRQAANQPYVLLTLTALFWGGNAIAGKLAIGHISPFLLTSLRWFVATAVILPFALPYIKKEWPVIRHNLWFLCLLGMLGFALFNNLMYLSLTFTSAINVAIVQASMPLMVFLLNFLIHKLRTSLPQLIGFGITAIGVIIITSGGQLETLLNLAFNFGDLIMLAATMIYGIYSVLLKQIPNIHWLAFIAILGASAFVTSLGFVFWEFTNDKLVFPDLQGWIIVAYTATFASFFSQIFWRRGLDLIGSNRGGVFINLVPIFGSLLAISILGEAFYAYHGAALLFVLFGVWLSQR